MSQASAPPLLVPPFGVVTVEHPCVVKNTDKAIQMLGGDRAIAAGLESGNQKTLHLRFNPEDVASRSILSINNTTSNVLLKITVPKYTGRKRKRGSNDPYMPDTVKQHQASGARRLLQSMQDNPRDYTVEPLGQSSSTHVWRAIPDFVYSTQTSAAIDEVRSKIIPHQYPLLKEFNLPRTYGLANTEVIPPPVLSTQSYPFNYNYRQNPAVKNVADAATGKATKFNSQRAVRIASFMCSWDVPSVPSGPSPDIPALSTQSKQVRNLFEIAQKLFEERSIWSKRALLNHLPPSAGRGWQINQATAYVAYAVRSGPWRDTFIRFGVDPRLNCAYRKYQTTMVQLVPKDERSILANDERIRKFARTENRNENKTSHIFTGTTEIPPDGKVWQLCDITDPQLKALIDLPDLYLRAECERRYFGWYPNGTVAKLKVGIRAKIDAINSGEPPEETARKLAAFFALPDVADIDVVTDDKNFREVKQGCFGDKITGDESQWASAYRSMCKTPLGGIPGFGGAGAGRVSKPKTQTTKSFLGEMSETTRDAEETGGQAVAEDDGMIEPEEDGDDQELAFGDGGDDENAVDQTEDQ